MSQTIGSFTVYDADKTNGTGCSPFEVTDNSTSQSAYYGEGAANQYSLTPGESSASTPNVFIPAGEFPYSDGAGSGAWLRDGSSIVMAFLGNSGPYADPEANGNVPCVNFGGLSGT